MKAYITPETYVRDFQTEALMALSTVSDKEAIDNPDMFDTREDEGLDFEW